MRWLQFDHISSPNSIGFDYDVRDTADALHQLFPCELNLEKFRQPAKKDKCLEPNKRFQNFGK